MWAHAQNPDDLDLPDWLDAGEALLLDGADRIYRDLLGRLFGAESMEEVEQSWAALAAEGSWRSAQIEKQEGEHRRKTGAPVHVSLIAAESLDAAKAEWAEITGGGNQQEDPMDDALMLTHESVWAVLADECGARPEMPSDFEVAWPGCVEYRFGGALGSGGKVYSQGGRLWVGCYPEDRTPERDAMVERATERLALLWEPCLAPGSSSYCPLPDGHYPETPHQWPEEDEDE